METWQDNGLITEKERLDKMELTELEKSKIVCEHYEEWIAKWVLYGDFDEANRERKRYEVFKQAMIADLGDEAERWLSERI